MKRVYPFHTRSAISSDNYKPDPDKATEWLKLILSKKGSEINKDEK